MQEQDNLYKTLPFKLEQDQSKPHYIILGTGLQECLIAAHISKTTQQPGLILDINKTYGSCLKTLTFKQLHSLTIGEEQQKLYKFYIPSAFKEKNQRFYDLAIENKAHRGYNIDIQPNFFFADSVSCDLLREADMDKYMEFRLVSTMLYYDKQSKSLGNVPLSKGKIFSSEDLSLLQRRLLLSSFHTLAKIYHKYNATNQNQNSTKQFDKDFGQVDQATYSQFIQQSESLFIPFISKITKNNKKIMEYMIYIVCNYQYNYTKIQQIPLFLQQVYTLKSFIKKFGKFLTSCGVYGQGPYLCVDNGIGDVPQSYSRMASIYGATYILHPKITIDKIQLPENQGDIKVWTNLYPEGYLTTKCIYYGPTFYEHKCPNVSMLNREYSFRLIILAEQSAQLQKQQSNQCPSITYFFDLQMINNPVYMFGFDNSSHSCPRGFKLYQFETIVSSDRIQQNTEKMQFFADQIVQKLTGTLCEFKGDKYSDQIKYVSAYIRQKRYFAKQKQKDSLEYILKDHSGIDLDSYFLNFKDVVGEKKLYFKKQDEKDKNQQREWIDEETEDLVKRLERITQKINQEQTIQIQQSQSNPIQCDQTKDYQEPAENHDSKQPPQPIEHEQKLGDQIPSLNKKDQSSGQIESSGQQAPPLSENTHEIEKE